MLSMKGEKEIRLSANNNKTRREKDQPNYCLIRIHKFKEKEKTKSYFSYRTKKTDKFLFKTDFLVN
jgi:hypothetical protein